MEDCNVVEMVRKQSKAIIMHVITQAIATTCSSLIMVVSHCNKRLVCTCYVQLTSTSSVVFSRDRTDSAIITLAVCSKPYYFTLVVLCVDAHSILGLAFNGYVPEPERARRLGVTAQHSRVSNCRWRTSAYSRFCEAAATPRHSMPQLLQKHTSHIAV